MSNVGIENLSDSTIRKYGIEFGPNETKEIPVEIMNAYSLAEISKALQYICRDISKQTKWEESDRIWRRYFGNLKLKENTFSEIEYHLRELKTPWIVRKYNNWKYNRNVRKRFKKEAKP